MKHIYLLIALLASLIFIVGCSNKKLEFEGIANHVGLSENSKYGFIEMTFDSLDGIDTRTFESKAGNEYVFKYEYLITEGTLTLQFRDSKDNVIDEIIMSGEQYKRDIEEIEADNDGKATIYEIGSISTIKSSDNQIKIVLIGEKAKGHFKMKRK